MRSLLYEILAAAGAMETLGNRILRPFGLTPMTFNILNLLSDGPLSQRDISDRVIVAASSITFQVRQLQKKGLVSRRRSDARTWAVSLTPLGRKTLHRGDEALSAAIAQIRLEPRLMTEAESALKALREHLAALNP